MKAKVEIAVLALTAASLLGGSCRERCCLMDTSEQGSKWVRDDRLKTYAELDSEFMLVGSRFSGRAPLGYFDEAAEGHRFRLLLCDGDGLGGVAIDLSGDPEVESRYHDAERKGKTLWLVVEGDVVELPPTKDQWNRNARPAASIGHALVVGMYEAELHVFPHGGEGK